MMCYPIDEKFIGMFENKEEFLKYLIDVQSLQCKQMFQTINVEDFYRRCIRFYNQDDYCLENNVLMYQHPITKKINKLHFYEHSFEVFSLFGFEKFLCRYFKECFCFDKDNAKTQWMTSKHKIEFMEK